jgi:peroxiredoxin
MTHRSIVLAVLVVAAVGCGGQGERGSSTPSPAPAGTKIAPGAPFPDVPLLTLDGDTVRTHVLVGGRESLVVFMEVGCEACGEFLDAWAAIPDRVKGIGLNLVGIVEDEPRFARNYAEEKHVAFPVYCDEKGRFVDTYGINAYPTAVALYADGRIAYVGRGVNAEFTPEKARSLFEQVKEAREKRSVNGAAGR